MKNKYAFVFLFCVSLTLPTYALPAIEESRSGLVDFKTEVTPGCEGGVLYFSYEITNPNTDISKQDTELINFNTEKIPGFEEGMSPLPCQLPPSREGDL